MDEIGSCIEIAMDDLESSRLLLEAGKYRNSITLSYYAMFSIARALLTGADILLCDEITSALDVSTQARVAELLLRLKRQKGISILLVSHDLALISQLCDRVMIMKDGAVLEEGNTREVLERPRSQYTNELLAAARELELPEVK